MRKGLISRSDSLGNASWQDPSSSNSPVGFKVGLNAGFYVDSLLIEMDYDDEYYDDGFDYSTPTSSGPYFKAPEDGLYAFNMQFSFSTQNQGYSVEIELKSSSKTIATTKLIDYSLNEGVLKIHCSEKLVKDELVKLYITSNWGSLTPETDIEKSWFDGYQVY